MARRARTGTAPGADEAADGSADGLADGAPAEGEALVALPAELGFVAARALHGELLALCDRAAVVIDASRVERLSTAGLLVIVSFLNARAGRTPPATVANPSGAFVDAFSELGLFATLMRMEFRT